MDLPGKKELACLVILSGALWVAAAALAAPAGSSSDPYATAPAYLHAVDPRTHVAPLVTAGQRIPLAGGAPRETFRVVGRLDGLGLYERKGATQAADRLVLLANHEIPQASGGRAGPLPSGARVSAFILGFKRGGGPASATVVSGRYFIEQVYTGDVPHLVAPVTAGISRLCSAFLATEKVGFDRPILLHGEESHSPETFDGRGGLAWATFEGKTCAFPRMGRSSWENIVVPPFTGARTVAFGLEDGPSDGDGLHSQLYMYVGAKEPGAADPLAANGLRNGRLYVFAGENPTENSEAGFRVKGSSVRGHWVELDWNQTDVALDLASEAASSFKFVRIEDGAADPKKPGVFYFNTTGAPRTANPLGRVYRLTFDAANPAAGATLTLLLDGSEGIVSPDNMDVNKHGEMIILEDPNYNLSTLGLTRDSSVWLYNTLTGSLTRIAEIDREAARPHALAADTANYTVSGSDVPGGWETSGVIDAEELLGRGSWLLDVQAHSLRIAPVQETVEGGQILHLIWKPEHKRTGSR